MADGGGDGGLCGSLSRIASDPEQIGALYAILGEFCHVVRNQLNGLSMSLYLARGGECPVGGVALGEIEAHYRDVERLVERLQTICRPMRLVPLPACLGLLLEERRCRWTARLGQRGLTLILQPPGSPTPARFDPMMLGQGLDVLVDWRAQVADPGATVRVAWGDRDGQAELRWIEESDDATHEGIPDADACSSLTLPLLIRIISAHGGTLDVSRDVGLELRMRWPL